MKELDIEFQGSGEVSNFTFRQIASSIYGYVYEISDANNNLHYETFERKEQLKSNAVIAGKKISFDEQVVYPKSRSFGDWAWCYQTIELAMKRFNNLKKENAL